MYISRAAYTKANCPYPACTVSIPTGGQGCLYPRSTGGMLYMRAVCSSAIIAAFSASALVRWSPPGVHLRPPHRAGLAPQAPPPCSLRHPEVVLVSSAFGTHFQCLLPVGGIWIAVAFISFESSLGHGLAPLRMWFCLSWSFVAVLLQNEPRGNSQHSFYTRRVAVGCLGGGAEE
jgi:hypothetical protein